MWSGHWRCVKRLPPGSEVLFANQHRFDWATATTAKEVQGKHRERIIRRKPERPVILAERDKPVGVPQRRGYVSGGRRLCRLEIERLRYGAKLRA